MATINGTADSDTLVGTAANDVINGLGADDNLSDTAGKDTLNGGPGDDTLAGGIGNDTYIVDSMLDQVLESVGEGTDTVFASSEFQLSENVENLTLTGDLDVDGVGNDLDNIIKGNSGDNALHGFSGDDSLSGNGGDDKLLDDFGSNTLSGGDGNDRIDGGLESDTLNGGNGNDTLNGSIGIDVMIGGKGDDEYDIDEAKDKVTETAGQGHDTVNSDLPSYTLAANVEDLVLASGNSFNGTGNTLNNKITGNANTNILDGAAGNDHLLGNEDGDILTGGTGNDTLDGGDGDDQMTGGAGNDLYILTQLDEEVVEAAGGGTDTIQSDAGNLDLANFAQIENLTLTGAADLNAVGNNFANKITGNAGKNELSGLDGNDTLDGGAGNDTLKGGAGNDTYLLDSADDQVFEEIGKGKDTILAAASYTLAGGQEIEVLSLQGSGDFKGLGNEFNNVLNGNSGSNLLFGDDNNDTLNGGDGNDLLIGGDGVDVMTGGKGNDTYLVDNAKDKTTEAANQGFDTVVSTLVNHTLGANVEGLALDDGAVNGTGNTLNNSITGNATGNTLDGGGGNDKLEGLNGDDTLIGGAGNDTLDGGIGADSMKGGGGNDFYIVDDLGDTVSETGGSGIDTVESGIEFKLGAGVENLTLTGGASIAGTGNELANKITGNDGVNTLTGDKGNDTLDGGVGEDILVGGAGNDTYIVDATLDDVQEQAGGGKDTVVSSAEAYQLLDEIENLVVFGIGMAGIGNNSGNVISTTAVNDVALIGRGGNDTITGGDFNDFLDGEVDNDKLAGGAGDDTLDGGEGNDTMTGGADNDYYIVEAGVDTVIEAAKGGFFDIVESRISSYTLAANVEGLVLKLDALNGTGNTLSNEITGNDKDNKLDGAAGNDALSGGIGNDNLIGQAGLDFLDGGSGNDTLKGGAGNDVLVGGFDDDVLFGDAGADFILIGTIDPGDLSLLGKDTINGFETGKDVIVLSDLLQAFSIDDTKAFTDGFVILTKDGANTVIEFDKDGSSGGASAVTLATVVGATVVQSDFEFGAI